MALTPLFLAALSSVTITAVRGFMSGLPASIPAPMGNLVPGLGDMVEMLILLTAPVGIYALFVAIGWLRGLTEMWTGSALALGLSTLAGLLLVTISPEASLNRVLDLLYWIAYLILPASIAAVIIVIAWTEKFRRSLRYTITREGVIARGGIWKMQEYMLPHHQVVKLILEQGPVGRLLGTGTIVPVGPGFSGQRDGRGAGLGGWTGSGNPCNPLTSLFGIRNPEKVMALLQQLISHPAFRGEGQVPRQGDIPKTL
jgi:hypothetical protein